MNVCAVPSVLQELKNCISCSWPWTKHFLVLERLVICSIATSGHVALLGTSQAPHLRPLRPCACLFPYNQHYSKLLRASQRLTFSICCELPILSQSIWFHSSRSCPSSRYWRPVFSSILLMLGSINFSFTRRCRRCTSHILTSTFLNSEVICTICKTFNL
ncbi:hypothetical protein BJV78DRAFT_723928 [Lactifluus subvellereus]|nr:hypothetical protein BJV78DRAFT_723928 [Lactifluus subvellereus]